MLVRSVRARRRWALPRRILVIATLSLAGISVASRLFADSHHHASLRDLMQLEVNTLARRDVPAWLAAHPNRSCPRPAELEPDIPELAKDVWGRDLIILCDADRRVFVHSLGPDGAFGTADDLVNR